MLKALSKPAMFVTGTDTDVGKTFVSCLIAQAIIKQWANEAGQTAGHKLGVCKPFGTDCLVAKDHPAQAAEWGALGGLLPNMDAVAMKKASGCEAGLELISPSRFIEPLAPAVAAEDEKRAIDWAAIQKALSELEQTHDAMLIEGVGGLLVPLDPADPGCTALNLACFLGCPVVVVARAKLGTLNHTAMTVRLLQEAGCEVAGVVVNGLDTADAIDDPSIKTNCDWIEKMTQVPVLCAVPKVDPSDERLAQQAVDAVDWVKLMKMRG